MRTTLTVFFVLLTAGSGVAQETHEGAVEPGAGRPLRPVYVRLQASPQELRGFLLRLGPENFDILVNGQTRTLTLEGVRRIQVEGDSVKNGAVIGAVILGALCLRNCGLELTGGRLAGAVAKSAALGGLFGALFDRDHVGRTTIYDARRVAGRNRARLAFRLRF
jgi:hypothetical protein